MKKLLLVIALFIGLLFTSCSPEELPAEPDAWVVKEMGFNEFSSTWRDHGGHFMNYNPTVTYYLLVQRSTNKAWIYYGTTQYNIDEVLLFPEGYTTEYMKLYPYQPKH